MSDEAKATPPLGKACVRYRVFRRLDGLIDLDVEYADGSIWRYEKVHFSWTHNTADIVECGWLLRDMWRARLWEAPMTEEGWFEERWRSSWRFRFWYYYHTAKEWLFDKVLR